MTKGKEKCNTCGCCGHFMRYVNTDGTPDNVGDCGSIQMNKECNDGVNPFKDDNFSLLQVEEREKACKLFRTTRTPRVRKYIKENPNFYVQL